MNRLINLLLTIACMLQAMVVSAQPANYDKTWVYGQTYTVQAQFTTSGPVTSFWDTTNITLRLTLGKNSNICDAVGTPILVTNGHKLWDNNRNLIDNGDTLSPLYMYMYEYNSGQSQASLILPAGDSIYYVFTCTCTDSYGYYFLNYNISSADGFDLMQYAKVDMKLNNYAGKVIDKRHTILDTTNAKTVAIAQMMAVRHGNGQDWWLVKYGAKHSTDTTEIYTFRVTKDSVSGPFLQKLPIEPLNSFSVGQSVFSPQGDKYACVAGWDGKVFLADFDRCTGLFSNPQLRNMPPQPAGHPYQYYIALTGAAFSPNGNFLYISRLYSDIQQLEVDNTDSATAWYKVAEKDTNWSNFGLYTGLYLAHDQRIYCGYEGPSKGVSYIANPDLKGASCNFCPVCLQFPTKQVNSNLWYFPTTPPNMPNYALGASSTPCQPPLAVSGVGRRVDIRLYPNPTDGVITLEDGGAGGRLELRDMPGRVVWQQQVAKGVAKHGYHLGELAPGVYGWSYEGSDGSRQQGKLVVAR